MNCGKSTEASARCWEISAYSRFKPNSRVSSGPSAGNNGEWIVYKVSAKSRLLISLKPGGHFMVTDDETVLESIFLLNAAIKPRACKVLQKKDTMMFLYKVKNESRMFRMQFVNSAPMQCSGINKCKECAVALSAYVEVRYADEDCRSSKEAATAPQTQHKEPNLLNLVRTIMNDKTDELPLIYRQLHMSETKDGGIAGLEQMVMLCFADPTFPTFVGQVEEILKNIKNSTEKESKSQ